MSANKPQPQQGAQKPNQEDEFNKGGQNRDQFGQQGGQQGNQQKDRDTPDNPGGQGNPGGK